MDGTGILRLTLRLLVLLVVAGGLGLRPAVAQDASALLAKIGEARQLIDSRSSAGTEKARALLLELQPAADLAFANDDKAMAEFLWLLSLAHSDQGYPEDALKTAERLRTIVARIGIYSRWLAQIDVNIGVYLSSLDRNAEAIASTLRALPVHTKAYGKNDPRVGMIHLNLGTYHEQLSEFDKALAAYRKALDISIRAFGENHIETAPILDSMGSVLDRLHRSEEALEFYHKATPAFLAAYGDGHPLYGRHLSDMATVLITLKRYPEGLDLLDKASRALASGGNGMRGSLAIVANNKGNVLSELGDWKAALESYAQALAVYEAMGMANIADAAGVRIEMAGVMADMGNYSEALKLYQDALPIYRSTFGADGLRTALLTNSIGLVHHHMGNHQEAIAAFRASLQSHMTLYGPAHAERAGVLVNMSRSIAALGDTREALAMLMEALSTYEQSPDSNLPVLRKLYLVLAGQLKDMGYRRSATLFAKLAVNAHQQLRVLNSGLAPRLSRSLAATMKPAYDLLVEQQIADGAFSDAQFSGSLFKTAELAAFTRGATTAEQDAVARTRLTKREAALVAQLQQITAKPAAMARDIQKLLTRQRGKKLTAKELSRLKRLEKDFAEKARAGDAALAMFENLEAEGQKIQQDELNSNAQRAAALQDMLAQAGPDVALYQAIALDGMLHLFVSAAGRDTVHRQIPVPRAELARKVYDAVNAVETRSETAIASLEELSRLLIDPVIGDIGALRPRVLMLDLSGFLRYVPYSALRTGGHYLVEDYALALHGSAVAARFEAAAADDATGAGFGVTTGSREFSPLPGVGLELEAIFSGADRAGPLQGMPVLDGNFTAASIGAALKAKPRYLHVASHFKFLPGNEDRSYLLLGNGESLSLAKLRSDTSLRFTGVDLLTLSACETARGGGSEGEEIESFGALAQINGASAVMATLWPIADRSTATLMQDFYEGRIGGKLNKAVALQRAQIAMLRGSAAEKTANRGATDADADTGTAEDTSTAHPYYWAAFILMGNWL